MAIKVLFFAQLKEITGSGLVEIDHVGDTDSLQKQLEILYPKLSAANYRIAVEKEIVNENTQLNPEANVAFLPPFSGG